MYQPMNRNVLVGFNCIDCDKIFQTDADLKKHKRRVHMGKSYHCSDCDFTTGWLESLKKHRNTKHSNRNYFHLPGAGDGNGFSDFRNVQTQTNPIVNAPMGVYQPSGYSHIQTQSNPLQVVNAPITGNLQHPPTYKHVQTQTIGDQPATYRDVGTQTYPEQRNLYTDSVASNYESEGSVTDFEFEPSSFENNVDINLSCLLGKLEETEKVLAHLFAEYKTQKHNWIKLIGKLGCFHEMNTSERKQFTEVVDRAIEFD